MKDKSGTYSHKVWLFVYSRTRCGHVESMPWIPTKYRTLHLCQCTINSISTAILLLRITLTTSKTVIAVIKLSHKSLTNNSSGTYHVGEIKWEGCHLMDEAIFSTNYTWQSITMPDMAELLNPQLLPPPLWTNTHKTSEITVVEPLDKRNLTNSSLHVVNITIV